MCPRFQRKVISSRCSPKAENEKKLIWMKKKKETVAIKSQLFTDFSFQLSLVKSLFPTSLNTLCTAAQNQDTVSDIITRCYQSRCLLSPGNLHNEAFINNSAMDLQNYRKKCLPRLRSKATIKTLGFVNHFWSVSKKFPHQCVKFLYFQFY